MILQTMPLGVGIEKFYFMNGLAVPHSDVDVQGKSHHWSSAKNFGHYDPELWQASAFVQLVGRGKRCQLVADPDATIRTLLHPFIKKNDLKGTSVYIGRKVGCRVFALGSLQAQTVFILANLLICFW